MLDFVFSPLVTLMQRNAIMALQDMFSASHLFRHSFVATPRDIVHLRSLIPIHQMFINHEEPWYGGRGSVMV